MCNLYDIGPSRRTVRTGFEEAALARLPDLPKLRGIRKTDTGLVVRRADGSYVAEPMRWGFERAFNPAINNTREDKLAGRMWSEAFRARRCLIPVAAFYEWTGPKGAKQTHVIHSETDDWLWCAGLWEMNEVRGPCFSMITTTAPPWLQHIHSRMIALFDDLEKAAAYLLADDPRPLFAAPAPLRIAACKNPLVGQPSSARDLDLFKSGGTTA